MPTRCWRWGISSRLRMATLAFQRRHLEVTRVKRAHLEEMTSETAYHGSWQDGYAILAALCVANEDLTVVEVDILHSKPEALQQSEARAVQKADDERRGPFELVEYGAYLIFGEDNGELGWFLGAVDILHPLQAFSRTLR
jgi:hypothetical protein